MSEHSNLLEIVRQPISPDIRLEVQASREEYERVQTILEDEESKYPRLWYDGSRNIAIVAGPPSALHGNMAGGVLKSIISEVVGQQEISSEITDRINQATVTGNTRGRTTRGWDGAILYQEPNRSSLMIVVEIGVSQAYESLRAAISWSVCALRCRLGILMCIREHGPQQTREPLQYSSIQEENDDVGVSEEDFRRQLMERPYGPLVRNGVVLETYRLPDGNILPETLLQPSRSFTIAEGGEFVGGDVPANLQEVVLGDCIPDHILSGGTIVATPVNFFRQTWFETQFHDGIVRTAGNRMRPKA
ncbi:hypothetical protein V1509DRAFT_652454 [Lipomyces kononenkoae]